MPRGISWSFNETEALIRLWADSTTQTALRLNSRNRCIYEDIANQLQAFGITRTADQCQMRIKLLKKMYRQTNEAIKRGDVFQQRPCPFYNEMHRIFAGTDDPNAPTLPSNAQSLLNDDDGEDDEGEDGDDDMHHTEEGNELEPRSDPPAEERISQAINRLIEYQRQTEARWYQYLEQQASLEQQRRQEDRAYQLQLIQLLTNVISTKLQPPAPVAPTPEPPVEKALPQRDEQPARAEKRKCSPKSASEQKKAKLRQSLPSSFYSLLAQIHNISTGDDM